MQRLVVLACLLSLVVGCTIQRAAEVQTPASISAHLEETGVQPVRSLRISRAELAAVKGTGRGLPWLQVFDRSGALIHEEDGYTLGLAGRLERALTRGEPASPKRILAEEVAKYETLDGMPAELDAGEADFVLVDHWATWCAPCRPQSRALQAFIAEHPAWDIDLVLVNWDEMAAPQGAPGTGRPQP